jgi:MFS family permease
VPISINRILYLKGQRELLRLGKTHFPSSEICDSDSDMIRALKENWALFAGMLMLMTANGMLVTLLTIRGTSIGMSETAIGLVQAAYPLGALLGCTYAPRLVERVGHVRAFGALASLCSISAIVHLVTIDAWSWGAMRLLAGFCFPGLYVISESWLNAKAENRSRAIVLSIYFVVQTLGASVGQGLAGLNNPGGTLLFGLTSILISLSLVPLLMSRNPAPDYVAPERLSLGKLARISPMAISGAILNGAAQAAFYVGVPLYALALGMSAAEAASLLVAGTIAGSIAQFPVGWISDRTDRRLVVGIMSILCTAVSVALAGGIFDGNLHAAVALIGGLSLPVYSLCVAHANDHITPSQIVPASGTLVLALNIGILFGAFVGPFAIGMVGPAGLAAFFAILSALTAAIAVIRQIGAEAPHEVGTAQPITAQGVQTTGTMHPNAEIEQ